jgi:hypothetical protein
VVCAAQLQACRDLRARALTVLDFNTFGSVCGQAVPGLAFHPAREIDEVIAAFNTQTAARPDFPGALAATEAWILRRAASAAFHERLADIPPRPLALTTLYEVAQ